MLSIEYYIPSFKVYLKIRHFNYFVRICSCIKNSHSKHLALSLIILSCFGDNLCGKYTFVIYKSILSRLSFICIWADPMIAFHYFFDYVSDGNIFSYPELSYWVWLFVLLFSLHSGHNVYLLNQCEHSCVKI